MTQADVRTVSTCLIRVSFETIDTGTNREGGNHAGFDAIARGTGMANASKARQVASIADEMRFDRREMDWQQITAIMRTSNDQTICHMKTDLMMLCRLVVAAALAAMVVTGCGMAKPATPASQPPQVSVVTVRRGSVQITTELPGRTSAYLVAQVRARVDGIVLKREFKEGGEVKAGQRLYQIDPAPYIAALNSATASLQKAEANLASMTAQAERYKVLVAANAVSKQDYDNAVSTQGQAAADVATGKAAVAMAQINLGYTNVMSPITGRSGLSLVTEGAYVQASAATLMTTVQQIDPVYVDLTQSSVEGLQLRRDIASGQLKLTGPDQAKVTLALEDGTQYREPGTLQFTDITVDEGTGSVTVRAIFPNPRFVLLPGMFVRARIEEGVNENAILVPQVGVTHDPKGQATALVVGADNKVTVHTLQLRGTSGNQWIVEGGLNDGDRVIVAGVQKVQPGAVVQAVESQTAVAATSSAPMTSTPVAAAQAPTSAVVSQAK
jgi:membrane fusion protein (multidrug efflux system)